MQGDGNLVLYRGSQALWATGGNSAGSRAIMQGDGNFVVYDGATAKWSSNTAAYPGAFLRLQDDGNLVIYAYGRAIWTWGSGYFGDTLGSGDRLPAGASARSSDGHWTLVMQSDGNLVLYHDGQAQWATGVKGPDSWAVMQTDGNFVLYNPSGAQFSTDGAGFGGAILAVQNDGNLVSYQNGHPIWTRDGGYIGDRLDPGWTLAPGAYLKSHDHQYTLLMQTDGNLVVNGPGGPVWGWGTTGHSSNRAVMQTDGNFVVYDGASAVKSSGTAGKAGAFLRIQDDSNLVIYQGGTALWDRSHGLLASRGQAIVDAAAAMAGMPYCWGGGNESGPTSVGCSAGQVGFDCTGLAMYAVHQATGITGFPHSAGQQWADLGTVVSQSQLQPGDVIFYGGTSFSNFTHAAIYAGGGMMWEAQNYGIPVGLHPFRTSGYFSAVRYT